MWNSLREWTGWTASWALYWPGLWALCLAHWFDLTAPVLYPASQWLFNTSSNVQDWGGGYGAWSDNFDVDLEQQCATCGNGPGSHSVDCPLAKE